MKVVEELKMKLENADAEKIKNLEQNENPIYWFLLLAEYPAFTPESNWFCVAEPLRSAVEQVAHQTAAV